MNKKLFSFSVLLIILFLNNLRAQSYQLTGNPVNTNGWTMVSPTVVNTDFVQLTPDQNNQSGSIRLNEPINLKYCDKWRVEFDFRIDSNQNYNGDGIAFWYLANPPIASVLGSGIGVSQNAIGLIVGFDTYNNTTTAQMSKIHIAYGLVENTTDSNNVEYFNTPGSSFHSPDLNPTQNFRGTTYKHVEVTGEVDPANPSNWIVKLTLDGNIICNQSFAPAGAAATMATGYFGFSASTGGATARHSIKNVKVYTQKVNLSQTNIPYSTCPNPSTGYGIVDLTSFNSQFVNTPANYTFSYYVLGSSTPISNPTNYQFNTNTTITVVVKDNSSLLCDNPDGKIQLSLSPFTATDRTISACNNNNSNTAIFDLTSANVSTILGITKKYYRNFADLTNGTNEIINPTAYSSTPTDVFVKVTTPQGCSGNAKITLTFIPLPVSTDATLQTCFIQGNETAGLFDLTTANVTSESGVIKKYYTSLTNALQDVNPITNPTIHITPSTDVYVRITSISNCYIIKKITLKVQLPQRSTLLHDKTICIDSRTTLDAGPGFDGYFWSTGDTTSSIQGVPVGSYWVQLKKGECITLQLVKVYAASNPIITSVNITNNTITINVSGGTAPYKYSLDGITWQDSNQFTGLPRGENKIYVKDYYNCEPIHIQITVPNLLNAITPNGDNVNDFIDYTALAYKKNLILTVYDRYGNKKFESGKFQNYKWDGTSANKKITTGTYWYTISWNENDKNNTLTTYNGWILVKNRD